MSSSDSDTFSKVTTTAISPGLSFGMTLTNRTLPPYSLQDFMYYLLHITHHAENLQFYLWLRDYTARFAAASADKRALSPAWDAAKNDPFAGSAPRVWEKGDGWGRDLEDDVDTKVIEVSPMSEKGFFQHGNPSPTQKAPDNDARGVRNQKSLEWQPCTIQPFRAEIDNVIALYLTPDSPRELNLSEKDRTACLHALQYTTHPSAFAIPLKDTTETLANYSHPSFICWADMNGIRPRRRRRMHGLYETFTTAVKSRASIRVGNIRVL